jgi:hypothetical protein
VARFGIFLKLFAGFTTGKFRDTQHSTARGFPVGVFRLVFALRYTPFVPACAVSFSDAELLRHRIEVEADSLFEAGCARSR